VAVLDRVQALGEEFSDFILIDKSRNSIIINLKKEYFRVLYTEFKRLGYKLTHVTHFKTKDSMTCVFTESL